MLLAGGEPMTRAEDLLTIAHEVPDVIFPVFTNGTLLDESLANRIRGQRNMVPVISLEGHAEETDARRGEGVAGQAKAAIARMHRAGVFFGTSLTVTRLNIDTVLDEQYLDSLMRLGCRLFFFVEYVPVREGTELLVLGRWTASPAGCNRCITAEALARSVYRISPATRKFLAAVWRRGVGSSTSVRPGGLSRVHSLRIPIPVSGVFHYETR